MPLKALTFRFKFDHPFLKDQRIVNLMMSRHEEQERARKEQLMLEMEWSEQRKLEEQLRQARHRQRQEEIWDMYKAKDAKQVRLISII